MYVFYICFSYCWIYIVGVIVLVLYILYLIVELWLVKCFFVYFFCRNVYGIGIVLVDFEENLVLYGYVS